MKVVITGGAGFIGSHLAERLLQEDCDVAVLDDLSTGSLQNVAHLWEYSGFSCMIDTVLSAKVVNALLEGTDLVFHLAAAVGAQFVMKNPVRAIETNVRGTEVVLRAAAKRKTPVVITSTSEVYGKSTDIPFREDADLVLGPPTSNRWSYGCSKALDECLGFAYWQEKQLPVTVTRLFNVIGPRQTHQYGMVVPTFVNQALTRAPITIFGSGQQKRCFTYVSDTVEALVRIAASDEVAGEIINIGNDEEITIAELASLVKQISGSESEIVTKPYEEAYGEGFEDMTRRVPSLEKLTRLIQYRPQTPVAKAIEVIVADARQKLVRTLRAG